MKSIGKTIIVLSLFIIASASMIPVTSAQGDWLTGWDYRRTVTITGAAGCGTDYQVFLNVTYWPEMQADFDDVCFTDNDGTTLLDYWLESKTDSTFAYFWVEIADSLEVNATALMYYGNAGASSASSGVATFPFFDDFDDGTINTTLWNTTWVSGGSVTEAGGIITVDGTDGAQSLGAMVEFGQGYAYEFLAKIDEQDTVTLGADERSTDGTDVGSYDAADIMFSTTKQYRTIEEGVQDTDARDEDFSTYQRLGICRNAATDTRFFIGRSLTHTMSTEIPDEDMGVLIYVTGASSEAFMNWTFVRKYVLGVSYLIGDWTTINTARFIFPVGWDPAAQFGYDAFFIFLGLIMIPASTMYFVRGGKEDMSRDKLFYFLIAFIIGWSLVIGGIAP